MHREIPGTGNKAMDRWEDNLRGKTHCSGVQKARATGHGELAETIYDPNVFILGTSHMEHFKSTHKRNHSKTL